MKQPKRSYWPKPAEAIAAAVSTIQALSAKPASIVIRRKSRKRRRNAAALA